MRRFLLLLGFITLLAAAPASAQWMYLDSNADGVWTSADSVKTSTPTTVDVYLNTNQNRDGSTALCNNFGTPDPNVPLDIFGYLVYLQAQYGTVSYGTFSNAMATFTTNTVPQIDDATDLAVAYATTTAVAPGLYKLGSVVVTVVSGIPALSIVGMSPLYTDPLSFGTSCPNVDGSGSWFFGTDWFDINGLVTTTDVRGTTWGAIKKIYSK
jgi:hypothetical protein